MATERPDNEFIEASEPWPLELPLNGDPFPSLQLFGSPLELSPRPGPTLEISRGTPDKTRLAALPKTSKNLSFLPSFGERSLLLFPRPQLLCPAGVTLRVHMALSLHLQLRVETHKEDHLLIEWSPPTTSRGAYGPVDAAEVCTSQISPAAPLQENLRIRHGDHPILALRLTAAFADDELRHYPCWAHMPLTISNTTAAPLEVSKVMLPTDHLSLFQHPTGQLFTNPVTMRLLSPQEAELLIDEHPAPDRESQRLQGKRPSGMEKKPYVFLHAYRTKTGLEHGF